MTCALTMKLSDARLRRLQTKLIYPNHRLPPWLTEDAPRDRSNRLLEGRVMPSTKLAAGLRCNAASKRRSLTNASQHRSKTDADQSVPPTEHIQAGKSARWRNEGSEARHAYWPTAHRCHHVRAPRSSREPQLCESGRHQLATAAPPTEAMRQNSYGPNRGHLTIRMSDARLRRPKPKLLYPDRRLPPRFTEVTTPAIARTMVRGRLPICQF
jgi:uncharacterized protein YifN (PemK superfamily)